MWGVGEQPHPPGPWQRTTRIRPFSVLWPTHRVAGYEQLNQVLGKEQLDQILGHEQLDQVLGTRSKVPAAGSPGNKDSYYEEYLGNCKTSAIVIAPSQGMAGLSSL